MKIGILGAGRMGRGLAELLGKAGHEVVVGSRMPGRSSFPAVSLNHAITRSEVVFIALPHTAIEPNAELLATVTPDTVVVDLANGVRVEDGRIRSVLERPHGRWVADLLPQARVVRAFTHVPDELLVSRAVRQPNTWAIAVAADDAGALAIVSELVRSAGYVPVPVGDLNHSAVLDPGGPLFPNMYLPGDMCDLLDRQGA
ncbi:hypothetical protein SRB5_12020 [Streptomyces sp. RB5]|uniref:Pyrroline-5-carboxylate reductase catalytic N-terminal domain-containing protein n=1 Tax=Streptomyces smaragdinus TaxID=2585196 RepID=A0A7K0CCC1_9ACTN|nr:NAD(P)-binding domain-containing protein [Streptomyces smaragdinus]MQY11088.1 hypothetical protein [Streptomyces smaragdinus]